MRIKLGIAQRKMYLPQEVREMLRVEGNHGEVEGIPNHMTLLVYPKAAGAQEILDSLDIIRRDLRLQVKKELQEGIKR